MHINIVRCLETNLERFFLAVFIKITFDDILSNDYCDPSNVTENKRIEQLLAL